MKQITKRQKEEALDLLKSRALSEGLVYKLLGWMQGEAEAELKGDKAKTVGKHLAEFVRYNWSEITNCPLAQ